MRAYRQRKRAAGFKQVNSWVRGDAPVDGGEEHRKTAWKETLKAEELKAARAEGRKLARRQDKSGHNGYVRGLCEAAAFFTRKDRADIAHSLLAAFYIDRDTAESALLEGGRAKDLTLASLDKARAWEPRPPVFR